MTQKYSNIKESYTLRRFTEVLDKVGPLKRCAEITGTHYETVSRWRNGKQKIPLSAADALCQEAGVSLDWLVGRGCEPKNESTLPESGTFDRKIMRDAIAGLELWLQENDLQLTPEKKADVCIAIMDAYASPGLAELEEAERFESIRALILQGLHISLK